MSGKAPGKTGWEGKRGRKRGGSPSLASDRGQDDAALAEKLRRKGDGEEKGTGVFSVNDPRPLCLFLRGESSGASF